MISRLFYWVFVPVLAVGGFGCKASSGVPIPILMYHRVGDDPGDFWMVQKDDFEAQMRYLKEQGYETILPKDLASGKPLPTKPLILTFDDGYLSLKTDIEPMLKKYDFRSIAYLITSAVSETPADRKRNEGHDCLTWLEIREMQTRGIIAFGGHSHRHLRLDRLKDPTPDVETCFRELQSKGGFTPDSFCYPYGRYDKNTIRAVRKAGFTTAVTAHEGFADTGKLNLIELPRLWVRGGEHEFDVEKIECSGPDNTVRYVVRHRGVSIPVILRLIWDGEPSGMMSDPVEEFGTTELQRQWKLSNVKNVRSIGLEIWDKYCFFRLFTDSKKLDLP